MEHGAIAPSATLSDATAAILDHVSDCIVVVARDGRITYANPAADTQGHAKLLDGADALLATVRRSGEPVESTADGWWRRVAPLSEDGLILTARCDGDTPADELFEHAAFDLLMLEVHQDGAVIIKNANAAFCRTTGLQAAAIAGRPIATAFAPVSAAILAADARICVTQGGFECQHNLQFPTGERQVRTYYRLMPRDGRAMDRVLVTQLDLTETRRIEMALRQALRLEVIGQLTGGVAHDFNNLLTAVLGSLEMLGRHVTDERQHRWIQVAAEAAQRGAALTQQLLAYARKQFLEPTATDIPGALAAMTELLRGSLGGAVMLDTAFEAGTWLAHADIGQLELSLLNLIVNARTAMPQGGRLTLSTRNHPHGADGRPQELDPGDYVVVSVADTGIGMPPDVLAHAMEPFFTTKGVGEGSGLGLSQAYGFARQLGGTLRLTSTPGAGTVAEIFLPRAVA